MPSTVPSVWDALKIATSVSAGPARASASATGQYPQKVRRPMDIPESELVKLGITRNGNTLFFPPGVDPQKFLRKWLK